MWEGEEKKCRVCGRGEEMWEHVWEVCTNLGMEKGWQEMVYHVLGEGGGKRVIEKIRRAKRGRRKINKVNERVDKKGCESEKNTAETEVPENVCGWMYG